MKYLHYFTFICYVLPYTFFLIPPIRHYSHLQLRMVSSPGSEKDERKSVSSGLETPIESLAKDLKNWMTNLPAKLKYVPFIYLAIPGKLLENFK